MLHSAMKTIMLDCQAKKGESMLVSDTVSRGESYVVAAVGTLLSKQREPGAQGMKGACWKQRRKERSC